MGDLGFDMVLRLLKEGPNRFFRRRAWVNVNMIGLQRPDENSLNTLPYLYATTREGGRVPWLASQTDVLAEDWIEV